MRTIENIEDVGPEHRARRLILSDTTSQLTSATVVKEMSLAPGTVVDSATWAIEIAACEQRNARERALRLVGYRERSVQEIRRRLFDDGYPIAVVEPLVQRFVELGLVDDARYARMHTRARLGAGYGARRIARELACKGVPAEIVTHVLEECAVEDPLTQARRALGGRVGVDRRDRERLVRRLVTKGYDVRTAWEAVKQGVETAGDDQG